MDSVYSTKTILPPEEQLNLIEMALKRIRAHTVESNLSGDGYFNPAHLCWQKRIIETPLWIEEFEKAHPNYHRGMALHDVEERFQAPYKEYFEHNFEHQRDKWLRLKEFFLLFLRNSWWKESSKKLTSTKLADKLTELIDIHKSSI